MNMQRDFVVFSIPVMLMSCGVVDDSRFDDANTIGSKLVVSETGEALRFTGGDDPPSGPRPPQPPAPPPTSTAPAPALFRIGISHGRVTQLTSDDSDRDEMYMLV